MARREPNSHPGHGMAGSGPLNPGYPSSRMACDGQRCVPPDQIRRPRLDVASARMQWPLRRATGIRWRSRTTDLPLAERRRARGADSFPLLERYARSSSLLFGAMEKEINTSWTIGPRSCGRGPSLVYVCVAKTPRCETTCSLLPPTWPYNAPYSAAPPSSKVSPILIAKTPWKPGSAPIPEPIVHPHEFTD